MGIFVGISRTATAKNEPGSGDFNPRTIPAIQKLREDPKYGISPKINAIAGYSGDDSYNYQLELIRRNLRDAGVYDLVEDYKEIETMLYKGIIVPELNAMMLAIIDPSNKALLDDMMAIFPRIVLILDAWEALIKYQYDAILTGQAQGNISLEEQFRKAFGDFKPNIGEKNTNQLLRDWFKEREDSPPLSVNPWEMRIGGSKFFVPPISVKVHQAFQAGSLSGGVLRQQNTPKFNSGHSETMIELTLYFPNHETIWGYLGKDPLTINFDKDGDSDLIIDQFISSLRGFITQFKYAPFVPVRNEYLNRTYDITAVALRDMTISTVEGFPFCLAVNVQMASFNHKAFLPPISDFNQAIHWGRFRQYIGRAAQRLNSIAHEGFLVNTKNNQLPTPGVEEIPDPNQIAKYESEPSIEFNKIKDFNDGRHFELYFPEKTPGKIFAPDTKDFRQPGEDASSSKEASAWTGFMDRLGFKVDNDPDILYDIQYDSKANSYPKAEIDILENWLAHINASVEDMNSGQLDAMIKKAKSDRPDLNGRQLEELELSLRSQWFNYIFNGWKLTPYFNNYMENVQLIDGNYVIREWLVPMKKMAINWENVIIDNVSVSLGNNVVQHQLQLQESPVYQHIGGKDSNVSVQMTIFGEDDLINLRRTFEHVNGLARLENAHGTLGFLGIKNVVTALAGIKYVLPLDFEVDSIPGYPHVYTVRMSFIDFDVFQQKREELSSAQQIQLIEAFGKRNPFLRIKQLWGAFNAYPDFPLSIIDNKGDVVGQLNPDFYFRSFQMYDNDIYNWQKNTPEQSAGASGQALTEANGADPTGLTEDESRGGSLSPTSRRIKQLKDLLAGSLSTSDRDRYQREFNIMTGAPTGDEGLPAYDSGMVERFAYSTLGDLMARSGTYTDHRVTWGIGLSGEGQDKETVVELSMDGIRVGESGVGEGGAGTSFFSQAATLKDNLPEETLTYSSTPGATAYADHQNAHYDGSHSPLGQYELMMTDAAYRDISGRMVRAFPTYMLWLIDEGGRFAGVKLFDNFYGLQSVIDFSVHSSEDVLGDTLVLRLSNLYSRLSSPYAGYLQPNVDNSESVDYTDFSVANHMQDVNRNIDSGTLDNYVVTLDSIRLKPGVRLHLRMGYGSNPNALQTVFNGTITEVRTGDIVEVVAQSDAIELSPYINSTNKDGHSGKIDGAMNTGMYLSEPRDLMVRLLSMGSSSFKEGLAHATQGAIFSENKFGIRHFGQILYEPMSGGEKQRHEARGAAIDGMIQNFIGIDSAGEGAGALANAVGNVPFGFYDSAIGDASSRSPLLATMQSMWANSFRRRDYELFKRNIYPGNGLGVAQFLGGDTLDGGLTLAYAAGQTEPVENLRTPEELQNIHSQAQTVDEFSAAQDTIDKTKALETASNGGDGDGGGPVDFAADVIERASPLDELVAGAGALIDVFQGKSNNPIFQAMGMAKPGEADDDLAGFDEVSFRAQTYMKSVWDMFQMCAALLPNYIVAVRPFEDRSTVFYGKPHWLYTSGLIPITAGIGRKDGDVKLEGPDQAMQEAITKVLQTANAFSDAEAQIQFLANTGTITPYATNSGMNYTGEDFASLPQEHSNGAKIPYHSGGLGLEMHLPPSSGAHKQLQGLPTDKQWPSYTDKSGSKGAFGGVLPDEEIWYMNMPWPYAATYGYKGSPPNPAYISGHTPAMYKGRKVVIYAPKTGKACICIVGDFGPGPGPVGKNIVAGASPETMYLALGIEHGDEAIFGWANDNDPLGPVDDPTGIVSDIADTTQDANPNAEVNYKHALTIEQIKNNDAPDDFVELVTLNDGERNSNRESHKDNPVLYAFEYGYKNANSDVPVWIAPSSNDKVAVGSIDVVGIQARRLYDREYAKQFDSSIYANESALQFKANFSPSTAFKDHGGGPSGGRSLQDANSIWDQFRKEWGGYDETKDSLALWNAGLLPNQDRSGLYGGPHVGLAPGASSEKKIIKKIDDDLANWLEEKGVEINREGDDGNKLTEEIEYSEHAEDKEAISTFMEFLWQDPYGRAWLAITTSRHNKGIGHTGGLDIDVSDLSTAEEKGDWNFRASPVEQAFQFFLVTVTDYDAFDDIDPNSAEFVNPGETGRIKMVNWLQEHNKQGLDSDDPLARVIENTKDLFDQTIGALWKAISTGLNSILGLYRGALAQLGQGLEQVRSMQRQANVLNAVFNDSIYYAEGSKGSIVNLADNPFTREYGEPVIEIREPFQRMHYLNSFQHILSNNISENLMDVATVVTASSDGNYPVSVYFDKGSPPERQTEKVVETGLFWDNARGSGFLGGILHPLLHPIESARGLIKQATGSSDELLSKRVALYHLKESLKDIYTGEIIVLGDPDIRPHDLVYLGDVYERMYGIFEVEQVVHHFTPETGFITSITPNAVVTINDPSRWSMVSWIWSWFSVKNTREEVRNLMYQKGKDSSQLSKEGVTIDELTKSLEPQLMGHLQYANGNSALIKDLASAQAMGNIGQMTRQQAIDNAGSDIDGGALVTGLVTTFVPFANQIADIIKGPFDWIKENLHDQHGCYISYLNKNGQPMDAGLSYNQGIAVGQHHSLTLLPGILGLDVNIYKDGHRRITYNDIFKALGYNEVDTQSIQMEQSFWTSYINAEILRLAGKSPDQVTYKNDKPVVYIVTVDPDGYFDGDTFTDTDGNRWRLAGVGAAETSKAPGGITDLTNAQTNLGERAKAYLYKRLFVDPNAEGYIPTVAIRLAPNTQTYDRIAAVVFHNVPVGTSTDSFSHDRSQYPDSVFTERSKVLYDLATQWPLNEWDSYMNDGRPYTINWEIIAAGLAETSLYGNNFDTDIVVGLGREGY